jgi:HD-GYP domain-containing protein (c-di-GMP phosphodiesterase class II)/uncharacterized membrane protein affecting hemolysin expression
MSVARGGLSLRAKLLVIILAGIVLVLLTVFAILEGRNHQERLDGLADRVRRFTQTNAVVLTQPMWTFDDTQLKAIVAVMVSNPEIKALEIADGTGQVVAQSGDVASMGDNPRFLVAQPIFVHDQRDIRRIGTLRVAFGTRVLEDQVRATVTSYLVTGLAMVVLISIIVVVTSQRLIFIPLERLRRAMVHNQDHSGRVIVDWMSGDEMGQVIKTYNTMEARRAELERTRSQMIDIGIMLGAERSSKRLFEIILKTAKEVYGADGGTVYIVDPEQRVLEFGVIHNDTLGIHLGGEHGDAIPFPPLSLRKGDGTENHDQLATHTALTGEVINIPDAYDTERFDFSGPRTFDAANNYRSTSFLVIPLRNRQGHVIGVLQLINATDPVTGAVIPFDPGKEEVVEAMAVQAGVALENQMLIEGQKKLLDSFIELIAAAIDAKSPYTGGHCARVPEITRLLTEAACAASVGPYADFSLNEDEWRELDIASWLHDCGKVTSPEYVVDKATKLETIYNRIHEIRGRFEVLWRDAEIAYRDGLLAGGDPAHLLAAKDNAQAHLIEDFAFVAKANIGGEFMDDADVDRLRAIGARTWVRHFDDRLGLSISEEQRLKAVPPAPVPAQEALLSDRLDHIVEWPGGAPPLAENNRYGIKMLPPKVQYNYGELYNLGIRRGTLTEEERYKINDHIIQTIVMLESLPLPPQLRRIPEYAGGHHEKMDGTGYPRMIEAGTMSIPARIMAIADIFEALTAADRPYKTPKTLSESLKIMGSMVKDKHIDPDLFALFLRSGVWRSYAETYLRPEQMDEVRIEDYLPQLV